MQQQLEGAVRNRAIFKEIQRALANLGYQRTWIQCWVKVKNLVATYRKHAQKDRRHQTAEDDEVEGDEDREDQGSSPHRQNEDDSNTICPSVDRMHAPL